jgi:hypothetical protein
MKILVLVDKERLVKPQIYTLSVTVKKNRMPTLQRMLYYYQ